MDEEVKIEFLKPITPMEETELSIIEAKQNAYELRRRTYGAAYIARKKELLPKVLSSGLNLIFNAFRQRELDMEAGEKITMQEAKIISDVVGNLDKIIRLDAGDPTEIVDMNKTVPTTFADIKRILLKDPFINTAMLINDPDIEMEKIENARHTDTGGESGSQRI